MADIDDSRSEHSAFSDETGAGSAVTSSSLAEWQKKYSPNTSRKIDLGRKKVRRAAPRPRGPCTYVPLSPRANGLAVAAAAAAPVKCEARGVLHAFLRWFGSRPAPRGPPA